MDILQIMLLLLIVPAIFANLNIKTSFVFNVFDFGAIGNGKADDTEAFLKAWTAVCGVEMSVATLIIPPGRSFLLKPIVFQGPCKATKINIQISGILVAPDDPKAWSGMDTSLWLAFDSVNQLDVNGHGFIIGHGQKWWSQSCRIINREGCTKQAPTAIKFIKCNDLQLRDIKIMQSPQTHVLILYCQRVHIASLHIEAPITSPNTDGIHIHESTNVLIETSSMLTGDDCISIGNKVYDFNISRIYCGPGHGISIGSLGMDSVQVSVEEIHIKHVHFYGTTNGARIKTWQGGRGTVRGISFEDLVFSDVENPIIINQFYCDIPNNCPPQREAIQISDVKFSNLRGTSKTPTAVTLNCSRPNSCTGIQLDNVNITSVAPGLEVGAYCNNAKGVSKGLIQPPVPCLNN